MIDSYLQSPYNKEACMYYYVSVIFVIDVKTVRNKLNVSVLSCHFNVDSLVARIWKF